MRTDPSVAQEAASMPASVPYKPLRKDRLYSQTHGKTRKKMNDNRKGRELQTWKSHAGHNRGSSFVVLRKGLLRRAYLKRSYRRNKVRAMYNKQTKLQQQLTITNYPKQRLISRTQRASLKRQRKGHLHGDEEGFCFCRGCGGLPSATHKLRCLYADNAS
jgi:hypothetical protein